MNVPNSRKAALTTGAASYFTGRTCPKGHVALRSAKNGECRECARLRRAQFRAENPALIAEQAKAYQKRYPERVKATKRRVYESRQAHYQQKSRDWRAANRPLHHAYLKAWHARNTDRNRHYCAKRHAGKLQRTPAWADIAAMDDFYRNCPPGHHVDHVIPMRGKLVSGLHVLNNLQYLPALDNLRKKNRFDPDTFVP